MIWTFGILAFVLLLILITQIGGRGRRSYGPFIAAPDQKIGERLQQINEKLDGLQTQVDGLERILKEVE
jgi:hypothetical protein